MAYSYSDDNELLDDEESQDDAPVVSSDSKPYGTLSDTVTPAQANPIPVSQPVGYNPAIAAKIMAQKAQAPQTVTPGKKDQYDLSQDSLLQRYMHEKEILANQRDSKIDQDTIANLGQSFSQLAGGANAPKANPVFDNIAKQNQELLASNEKDTDRSAKVMDTIAAIQGRKDIAQGRNADRALQRDAMTGAKSDAQVNKWMGQMKDDLDPNKARGGNMAANQKRVDNADRVQALLSQVNNNPDPRQMEELAISTQALLSSSGSPAAEQVKSLIPQSLWGNSNKLKEWLTNNPTGTGQQEFVKRMADTVSREKEVAQGQVKTAQKQRLSAYSKFKKTAPDEYGQILNSYGLGEDDAGLSSQTEGAMTKKQTSPPPVGQVEDGHKFMGGDPSDPKNWTQVQ